MTRASQLLLVCIVLCAPLTARADLPSFLRMRNGDIEDGNALLEKGDAKGALAAYDKAARALPDSPGVQLDRGLALLKMGELPKAREALLAATAPAASPEIRADAYKHLALAFYRDADALAGQKKHDEAQKQFAESVDAAKHALRLRPGDPSAAWNLELAARRMREEQQKKKEEDDKKKQDQKDKDQEKKDGDQKQDGDPNQDPNKDPSKQDENKDQSQDPNKDSQAKNDEKKPEDKPGDKPQDKPEQPKDKQTEAQKQEQAKRDAEKAKQAQEAGKQDKADKPLPSDVAHALDALQDGEENFERVRARQRAQQERRAPEKDW